MRRVDMKNHTRGFDFPGFAGGNGCPALLDSQVAKTLSQVRIGPAGYCHVPVLPDQECPPWRRCLRREPRNEPRLEESQATRRMKPRGRKNSPERGLRSSSLLPARNSASQKVPSGPGQRRLRGKPGRPTSPPASWRACRTGARRSRRTGHEGSPQGTASRRPVAERLRKPPSRVVEPRHWRPKPPSHTTRIKLRRVGLRGIVGRVSYLGRHHAVRTRHSRPLQSITTGVLQVGETTGTPAQTVCRRIVCLSPWIWRRSNLSLA